MVAVYDKAVGCGVHGPAHGAAHAVVGAPDPEVVANHVVGVDYDGAVDMHGCAAESADAEEQVGEHRGVGVVAHAGGGVAHAD